MLLVELIRDIANKKFRHPRLLKFKLTNNLARIRKPFDEFMQTCPVPNCSAPASIMGKVLRCPRCGFVIAVPELKKVWRRHQDLNKLDETLIRRKGLEHKTRKYKTVQQLRNGLWVCHHCYSKYKTEKAAWLCKEYCKIRSREISTIIRLFRGKEWNYKSSEASRRYLAKRRYTDEQWLEKAKRYWAKMEAELRAEGRSEEYIARQKRHVFEVSLVRHRRKKARDAELRRIEWDKWPDFVEILEEAKRELDATQSETD